MTRILTCPSCGFSKSTDPTRIPRGAESAQCPRCACRFPLGSDSRGSTSHAVSEESGQASVSGEAVPCDSGDSVKLSSSRLAADLIRSPYRVFTSGVMDRDAPAGIFSFGLLLGSLGTMAALFWQFLVLAWRYAPEASGLVLLGLGGAFMLCIALAPLWVVLAMAVNTAIVHICLRLVGAGRHGLEVTFRVVACSQSAKLLGALPLVGMPAAFVWQMVIQVVGLREAHGISSIRLVLAAAIPAALVSLAALAAAL